MYTEEEAKTKWCPEVRMIASDNKETGFFSNRLKKGGAFSFQDNGIFCIGSECMAWRWSEEDFNRVYGVRYGYCGKAGKPE